MNKTLAYRFSQIFLKIRIFKVRKRKVPISVSEAATKAGYNLLRLDIIKYCFISVKALMIECLF